MFKVSPKLTQNRNKTDKKKPKKAVSKMRLTANQGG
jgi:hypothetical protein